MVYCSADGWQLKLGTLLLAGGINGLHRVVSPITGVAARATPKHFRSSEEPELLWSTLLITTAINTSKQHSCCSYTLSNCNPSITSSSQSTTTSLQCCPALDWQSGRWPAPGGWPVVLQLRPERPRHGQAYSKDLRYVILKI